MDYEAKAEETPFTPEIEAGLRQLTFGMSYAARLLAVISNERLGSHPHSQCVKSDSK